MNQANAAVVAPEQSELSGVIDCDVHFSVGSYKVLLPFVDNFWRAHILETAFKGPVDTSYPSGSGLDPAPLSGHDETSTAASLDRLRAQVLDGQQADVAILTTSYAIESIRNPFGAAALASAVNDWQMQAWLDQEPRLRGSVIVPVQDAELAAREIDRVGGHPGFVQVLVPVHSEALYGHRCHYPIYEAATREGLAIAIHAGGNPGTPPSAVGWPSYFVEDYVGMSHIFQSQLISLVTEGAFDRFPDLRVVLLESGVTWLPSLMWRLDKEWKGLRREVPWVRRHPSDYIREHVRLTTEPFDAPAGGARLPEIIGHIGSEDVLMFASDYPHRHPGPGPAGLLSALAPDLRRKLTHENAASFYRIGH